jgi:hypothetical protein
MDYEKLLMTSLSMRTSRKQGSSFATSWMRRTSRSQMKKSQKKSKRIMHRCWCARNRHSHLGSRDQTQSVHHQRSNRLCTYVKITWVASYSLNNLRRCRRLVIVCSRKRRNRRKLDVKFARMMARRNRATQLRRQLIRRRRAGSLSSNKQTSKLIMHTLRTRGGLSSVERLP